MPRRVLSQFPDRATQRRLAARLADELRHPGDGPMPEIIEELVARTRTRHVRVIWDAWSDLAPHDRSQVILDAYDEAEGEGAARNISIAMGLTPPEALAIGLLPYTVVSLRREKDAVSAAAYRRALRDELARSLAAEELRFASLEAAETCRERLVQALPGSRWGVVHEVPTEA